jgi:hypothetical protein
MKRYRIRRILLPALLFLFGFSPAILELYHRWVLKNYGLRENHGCVLLARGYAREFEGKFGRRPSIEELTAWATQRFGEAVDKMDFLDRPFE